jgi:hypothetical protein
LRILTGRSDSEHDRLGEGGDAAPEKTKKKKMLKLLGVVPIPGTHKTYREDRREKRIEKRLEGQNTRPSWEQNVSAGKY